MPASRLQRALTRLGEAHGRLEGPPVRDPVGLALWENVAYLVDDARRAATFARLEQEVGLEPQALLDTPLELLAEVIADGGMKPPMRAAKLHKVAEVALALGPDALATTMVEDPAKAKRLFKRFPGFGDPGAEKALLFHGAWRGLAPDSNALRVLLRLGYGAEGKDYRRTYVAVAEAVAPELPDDPDQLVQGHLLLRAHGRTVCRNKAPDCQACPLQRDCPTAP